MRSGITAAESMPDPDPELVTRHTYAE
jgi:hypothetical protein